MKNKVKIKESLKDKENLKPKKVKHKKENIFKRIRNYFKGVSLELKKVKWSSKKDLLTNSSSTLFFVFVFALYFGLLDIIIALVKAVLR